MSKKYPGLYLYFDWLKNLERLPREVGMEIVLNLYHFAQDRREPQPLSEPQFEIVQDMLMDQVKRSMKQSDSIKIGLGKSRTDPRPPIVSVKGMSDEEVLEYFRTHDEYADDDPYELLYLQRLISGERTPRKQSSELHNYNMG